MYEQIVDYYDLIHWELSADIDFIQGLVKLNGKRVLELGCGTGRLVLPLARSGCQVTGIDRSTAMLEKARQKVQSEPAAVRKLVNLVEGDMTAFDLGERYDLVIIPHNTLMHLDQKRVKQSLVNARRHLEADGMLFVDVDNPMELADSTDDGLLLLQRSLLDPVTGETVLQMASSRTDTEKQVRHTTWIFDASAPEGGAVRRTISEMAFHYLFLHQFEILFTAARLRLLAHYGGYNKEAYSEEAERLLLVAMPA